MRARRTAAIALLVTALAAGCGSGSGGKQPVAIVDGATSSGTLAGDLLQPPAREPALALEDTENKSYDLRKATAGKIVLVYFGYTHCPDVCPTFMADIAQALRESTATVRSHVAVVFISVDPKRDSATVIRKWLDHFNRTFVGLRGSIRQIIAVQHAMAVPASQVRPHSKHGYTVEHSSELLAFTPDRKAHVLYLEGPTTISDLRHDLATMVAKKMWGA